jgi:ribonuclease BN (tRNA processing enzyme)
VPFAKVPGNIEIEEVRDFNFNIGAVQVRAQRSNHPGLCFGYRLFSPDGLIVFFPDSEPHSGGEGAKMVDFIRDADALILDSQYDAAEYKTHVGWGHGSLDGAITLALQAGVRHLCLFHHDPDHTDEKIDGFVRRAHELVAEAKSEMKVDAAREGMTIELPEKSER